ncbi:MAG: alkene reductase [Cyanobacteria bacterium P01_D01_bin.73]
MTLSPKLLSPVTLGDLELSNRVVLAPLTRGRAGAERIPNALMAKYYAQRAKGNLLISEATVISEQGIGWQDSPGIYSDVQAAAWKGVTDAVHEAGGKMILQLWHCGRSSHSSFHNGEPPVSSSAVKIDDGSQAHTPNGKQDYEVPRSLTTDEVVAVVEDYRKAAERAKAAGFDGVEIHGANGYLIDQFLQSKINQRSDRYGGSIEKRYQFLKEITEAVLTVWPANRVGVRLSPNGVFNDAGSPDYRETYLYIVEQLKQYDLGYLHIMDGLGFGFHEQGEPMTLAEFRAIYPGIIIGNCGYTQETAEAAIAAGNADLIAFGRPYIANPDLIDRFTNGHPLADYSDPTHWYSSGSEGYADYPTHGEAVRVA